MRRLRLTFPHHGVRTAALAALVALAGSAAAAPAPAFRAAAPEVRVLPNGLRVALFASGRLPLVQMQVVIPAGVAQEPAETPGVASATAQLLRMGTTSRSAEAFAADLEQLGGSISAAAARDFSTVSGVFLARDFEAGLELLADAVVQPIFPEAEVERLRLQTRSFLLGIQQDPVAAADENLWGAAFEGHAYARRVLGSPEGLARLDREAVRAFHRDFYRPDRAVLVIAGDVSVERALAAAGDRFGTWAGRTVASPAQPPPMPPATPRIRILDRPGLERSEIRIGLVTPGRAGPDEPALQIANQVLGGAVGSPRLGKGVRGDGAAGGGRRSNFVTVRDAGLLSVSTAAPNDSVAIVVGQVRDVLGRMVSAPPEEPEIAPARHTLAGGYPFQFETLGGWIAQWTAADCYGLPAGALAGYPDRLSAVTAADVAGAARRWLDPAHMVLVVAGPAAVLRPQLEGLGAVEVVTPGSAPSGLPTADPAQRKRGRELIGQTLVAHGGLDRLRRVKDSTVSGDLALVVRGSDATLRLQVVRKEPFRMAYTTKINLLDNGQILDGRKGWLYSTALDTTRVLEADSAGILGMRATFLSDPVHVLLAAADTAARVAWRGTTTLDQGEADVVEVTSPPAPGAPPERRLLYLDAKDHRLVGLDQGEREPGSGRFQSRRLFRDFRPVQGISWPFGEDLYLGGQRAATLVVGEVLVNTGVPDSRFLPPAGTPVRR